MNFEFVKQSDDQLSQKRWVFTLTEDVNIVLNDYYEESRQTKKHKFKSDNLYRRLVLDNRCNTIELKDIKIPSIVASNIVSQINCKLRFVCDYRGTKPIRLGD